MNFVNSMVFVGAVALFLPTVSWAENVTIYQCKGKNGTVIFSGTPCGSDAKERVIVAPNPGTGADTKGISELAHQYDRQQAQAKENAAKIAAAEAAARAKAQERSRARDQTRESILLNQPEIIGYPLTGYYPGIYPGYDSDDYPGDDARWWLHGRVDGGGHGYGWSVGVGSGFHHADRPRHARPPRPSPPPIPYVYKNPGISGQFPGGAPGSTGSNFQPARP